MLPMTTDFDPSLNAQSVTETLLSNFASWSRCLGEFNNNKMANRRSILAASVEQLPASSDPLRELFEACKTGDISRVKKLISPQTVNARDTAGRKSTPLHFAAGESLLFLSWSIFVSSVLREVNIVR
jgi:hypothetical protein